MPPVTSVRALRASDRADFFRMRQTFWPDSPASEVEGVLARTPEAGVTLVAEREGGGLGGFIEVEFRRFAEGCSGSPVPYVEGIWVDGDLRRVGLGARLVRAAEAWCMTRGFRELASDCELSNVPSIEFHRAVGFQEVQRSIAFHKRLGVPERS